MGPDQPYDAPRAGPPGEPDVLAAGPRPRRTWTRRSRVLAALAVLLVAAGLLTWAGTGARRTPERGRQVATADGRLTRAVPGALLSSDDGGATWHRTRIPRAGAVEPVPSAVLGTSAALLGDQGVTWLPFAAAVRVVGGHTELFAQPRQPRMFVDRAVVLPDGRLLVDVVAWSSDRNGDHVGVVGPFVSADWRHWRPLRPGPGSGLLPRDRRTLASAPLRVVAATVRAGSARVLVVAGRRVFAVDGPTWTRVPHR